MGKQNIAIFALINSAVLAQNLPGKDEQDKSFEVTGADSLTFDDAEPLVGD
jgi:hypothetical protein